MKLKSLNFLQSFSKRKKRQKKKIVLCHGDYDFIHLGHIKHFQAAKKLGDYLIVSITGDAKMQKGINRPIYKEKDRIEFLSLLSIVDYLYVDQNISAVEVISKIKPNYYVKGIDYLKFKNDISGNILKEKKIVEKYGGKLSFTDEESFSASSLINKFNLDRGLIALIEKLKKSYNFHKVKKIIDGMLNKKVLVIGDTIIDEYVYVKGLGKPSKENIVASLYDYKELFLGGLFACLGNISLFCNNVDFITVIGTGKKDYQFIKKNIPKNIKKKIFLKNKFPITKKTRYIERTHANLQKLYEIYEMKDDPLSKHNEKKIINYLNRNLPKYDFVIVNDYGHGLLTKKIINIICKKSKFSAVNVQINAGNRGYNLVTKYKKASYYCVDMDEAKFALQDKYIKADQIPKSILKITKGENISITMGQKGSMSYLPKNKTFYMPSFTNVVVDTMSAGDSYFVMSSMLLYLSKSVQLSAFMGNLSGAITVGVPGCVPIEKAKFFETLNTLLKT